MSERLVITSRQHPWLVAIAVVALVALGIALIPGDGRWFDKLQAWTAGAAVIAAAFLWGWRSSLEISSSEIVVRGFLRPTVRLNRSDAASAQVRRGRVLIQDASGRRLAKLNPNRWGVAAPQLNEAVDLINSGQ